MAAAEALPVLVVGAGPAGLATSAELRRLGVAHRLFERGPELAHSWANLYDSLTLHTGKHMSALPGMRFGMATPLFPTRDHFVGYLHEYAQRFQLPVEPNRAVERLERVGDAWVARTAGEDVRASAVVLATGIIANPRRPAFPGEASFGGRIMHSVAYRRPAGFEGRRVLVVGVGNSGGEIGSELARHGAKVTVAVRSGAHVVPRDLLGVPIQYLSYLIRKLPRPAQERVVAAMGQITERRRGKPVLPRPAHSALDAIPLIGFNLVDAIREGLVEVRGGVEALTATGARFTDGSESAFDDIILATGFAAAVGPLAGLIQQDARGFARRTDRVTSADQPDLYFVGHNYDSTGGLYNIRRDSRIVAERLARRR